MRSPMRFSTAPTNPAKRPTILTFSPIFKSLGPANNLGVVFASRQSNCLAPAAALFSKRWLQTPKVELLMPVAARGAKLHK